MIRIALDRSWPDVIHALHEDPAFRTSFAERLRAVPPWVSTAGLGVPWLHARLDTRPKHFRHAPYRLS